MSDDEEHQRTEVSISANVTALSIWPQIPNIEKSLTQTDVSFTEPGLHSFDNVFFYCLDAPKDAKPPVPTGNATPARRRKPSKRDEHVWDVQARIEKYTDCKIINVRLKQANNVDALYDYIDKELETKTEDDLVIFYYYGQAGAKDREYSWKFDGPKHVYFNAYDIFGLCGASGLACMFLLDCDIPTLWLEKLPTPKGHISVFARGGQLRKPNGEIEDDDHSFTESFTDNLSALAKDTDPGKRALRTIPQLITPPQSKPTWSVNRIDTLFESKVGTPTMNIVVDPERVRQNKAEIEDAKFGEVEFFLRVRMKGDKKRPELVVRSPDSTPADIVAPLTPSPVQTQVHTAVMVAPPTPSASAAGRSGASGRSTNDEGYNSDDSDESTLFLNQSRRRASTPPTE